MGCQAARRLRSRYVSRGQDQGSRVTCHVTDTGSESDQTRINNHKEDEGQVLTCLVRHVTRSYVVLSGSLWFLHWPTDHGCWTPLPYLDIVNATFNLITHLPAALRSACAHCLPSQCHLTILNFITLQKINSVRYNLQDDIRSRTKWSRSSQA